MREICNYQENGSADEHCKDDSSWNILCRFNCIFGKCGQSVKAQEAVTCRSCACNCVTEIYIMVVICLLLYILCMKMIWYMRPILLKKYSTKHKKRALPNRKAPLFSTSVSASVLNQSRSAILSSFLCELRRMTEGACIQDIHPVHPCPLRDVRSCGIPKALCQPC